MPDAAGIIGDLGLKPNPEGGAYGETFRDAACLGSGTTARGASTAIYFLLQAGERSHWHRVDAAEAWHWYAGAPLRLMVSADGRTAAEHRMGPDIAGGERPQAVVPAKAWQAAESLGAWTLRSEEHTSELQSLMRISYAVFCLKKQKHKITR